MLAEAQSSRLKITASYRLMASFNGELFTRLLHSYHITLPTKLHVHVAVYREHHEGHTWPQHGIESVDSVDTGNNYLENWQ